MFLLGAGTNIHASGGITQCVNGSQALSHSDCRIHALRNDAQAGTRRDQSLSCRPGEDSFFFNLCLPEFSATKRLFSQDPPFQGTFILCLRVALWRVFFPQILPQLSPHAAPPTSTNVTTSRFLPSPLTPFINRVRTGAKDKICLKISCRRVQVITALVGRAVFGVMVSLQRTTV